MWPGRTSPARQPSTQCASPLTCWSTTPPAPRPWAACSVSYHPHDVTLQLSDTGARKIATTLGCGTILLGATHSERHVVFELDEYTDSMAAKQWVTLHHPGSLQHFPAFTIAGLASGVTTCCAHDAVVSVNEYMNRHPWVQVGCWRKDNMHMAKSRSTDHVAAAADGHVRLLDCSVMISAVTSGPCSFIYDGSFL